MKLKSKISHKWFLVGLLSVFLAAPNSTFTKFGTDSVNPILYVGLRFFVIGIVTLPFVIKAKDNLTRSNVKHTLISAVGMTVAVTSYVGAISLSQASYVSIITLITPIFFIIFSNKLTGEKISRRAIFGITLAMLGAMIVVLLPIAIRQSGDFVFYPLATLLALINTIAFPITIIYYRKANDEGVPIMALMNISAWVVTFISVLILFFMTIFLGTTFDSPDKPAIIAVFYSAIAVALLSRAMGIKSYEFIGAVRTSALAYLETFLAILIPILVLGEKLSIEMIIGGIVILMGVFVVEHHKSIHHKHHFIFRNH